MELSGLSLAVDTEISLSFSTLEDTGTILLAVGGGSPSRQKVAVILLVFFGPFVLLTESLQYNILLKSELCFILSDQIPRSVIVVRYFSWVGNCVIWRVALFEHKYSFTTNHSNLSLLSPVCVQYFFRK